jgi:WD40 repeat protein
MRYLIFLGLFLICAGTANAQRTYNEAIQQGDAALRQGAYKTAIDKYFAAEAFDTAKKDAVRAKVNAVFDKIEALRKEAEAARKNADDKTREAIAEKQRADSTATAAQRAARRAYANDLAYKSQIALRDGDRTAAFRLAEFAHRYVDDDNLQVTRALVEALYYNDKPDPTRPPLSWASNLEGHSEWVWSVAFSPDGSRLATGSGDGTAKIWDLESGKASLTLEGHSESVTRVAFSPDGSGLVTGSDDGTAKIWDLESGKASLTLEGHREGVISVAFSPDGSRLATGSGDGTAKIWDLESGKASLTLGGDSEWVLSVAFSPDGSRLVTGSSDKTAKIWDLESGKASLTLEGHSRGVISVAFSPDGSRLATGSDDWTAKIWDLESGKASLTLEGHSSSVLSVAFSPDGSRLATGSYDGTAKIWDLESGKASLTLEVHRSWVSSVAFSPDGSRLATGSSDKTAKIWDLESGKASLTLEGHSSWVRSVAYSPDGSRLATGSVDKTAKIWDLESGKAILTLEGHSSWVLSVAFSPDGSRLATGSDDWTAKIWDLESGKASLTLEGHREGAYSVAFSPDGSRLATGSRDGTAKIWDLESGKASLTLEGHSKWVYSVAYSPDGSRLATGSVDKTAKIWDLESGKASLTLEDHSKGVFSVAFSPDGSRLATGSGDRTAKIWDLESGKEAMTLQGHSKGVYSVAFSPDGKRLATGSSDDTAKIWDLESGKASLTLEGHREGVRSVAFSPDGSRLATGSDDGPAKIWELTPQGCLGVGGRDRRLAGLILPQLSAYGLEGLLDQLPGSEDRLIATGEVWQIKAFADLHAKEAAGSNILEKVNPQYARAERLYAAALALQDEAATRQDYAEMLRRWAAVYRAEGRTAEEQARLEKAQRLWHDKVGLDRLFELVEASGEAFTFHRLLEAEYVDLLRGYGDYFFKKEEWSKAEQLYAKAQGKARSARVLLRLFEISEKTGGAFDFGRFLAAEDTWELWDYGDYFFEKEAWGKAEQLYEKAQGRVHSARLLKRLFEISEKTGGAFDFGHFMAAEDAWELRGYGDYFFKKEAWSKAEQLYEKAQGKAHSKRVLKRLFELSEKTGSTFDFGRFMAAEDAWELRDYGDYFFEKEEWGKAEQLYEKAQVKAHSARVLIRLFEISEKTGSAFDFGRFMASEDAEELRDYGDYFFEKEAWGKAEQLYEKAQGKAHSARVLLRLFEISEKTGEAFDFGRFLAAEDAWQLGNYARGFIERIPRDAQYKDRVPAYQNALRIREQQIRLDTSAALRAQVVNEYNILGYYQLFLPDGAAAEASIRRGLELDVEQANKYLRTSLAPALLLQGKTAEAKAYYLTWAEKPFEEQGLATYRDAFRGYLLNLEEAGVEGVDFELVRGWLKE